jgi:hypothetical protein
MDDAIHDLLMHSAPEPPTPPQPKRAALAEKSSPNIPNCSMTAAQIRH